MRESTLQHSRRHFKVPLDVDQFVQLVSYEESPFGRSLRGTSENGKRLHLERSDLNSEMSFAARRRVHVAVQERADDDTRRGGAEVSIPLEDAPRDLRAEDGALGIDAGG